MPVRDAAALEAAELLPFAGYARRRPRPVLSPDTDRVAACVALLATMVISGIALGTPRRGVGRTGPGTVRRWVP
jgi:hypothetical protein